MRSGKTVRQVRTRAFSSRWFRRHLGDAMRPSRPRSERPAVGPGHHRRGVKRSRGGTDRIVRRRAFVRGCGSWSSRRQHAPPPERSRPTGRSSTNMRRSSPESQPSPFRPRTTRPRSPCAGACVSGSTMWRPWSARLRFRRSREQRRHVQLDPGRVETQDTVVEDAGADLATRPLMMNDHPAIRVQHQIVPQ